GPQGVTPCPTAPLLVAALRNVGISPHTGPVATSRRLVDGDARDELLATGAIAVDMESATVAHAASGHPFVTVRVVVDTPRHGLRHPSLIADGFRALRVLRKVAAALDLWSA